MHKFLCCSNYARGCAELCATALITAMSHTHFVRWCLADLGPCADLLRFTGQKERSRRSRAVIVSLLFVLLRAETV